MSIPYGPILIVEDMPNVQEMLEVILRFKGYPVVTASNGQEALEQISIQRPAMVITDILMPKMDGYSLAHSLRKNPQTRQIPIVFVSATYITQEDKRFAMSLGSVRFLEKPIDTEDFLLTVGEILTQGIPELPRPLRDEEFYRGYRERLEQKLRYKNTQIARTERLLQSLPEEQKPAFDALLVQAIYDRDEIQKELDQLYRLILQYEPLDEKKGE
jgi:CheY-like chemotaxis protein